MKPKINRKGNKNKVSNYDTCQTPAYAIEPLLRFIPLQTIIWEPARGEGILARALNVAGYHRMISTELKPDGVDFFKWIPHVFDCIVTNPPYSIKYDWLERCYSLGKPFALLMPVEMISAAKAIKMFQFYRIQIIFMYPRIDFKMPKLGWSGAGAQFPTCWYTWKLHLPKDIMFHNVSEWKSEWASIYKKNGKA